MLVLWGMHTLSGEITLSELFCLSSEKGSTLKGKNLLPGSKLFPFRVEPFLQGIGVQESKQTLTKVVSLVKNGGKSTECISSLKKQV